MQRTLEGAHQGSCTACAELQSKVQGLEDELRCCKESLEETTSQLQSAQASLRQCQSDRMGLDRSSAELYSRISALQDELAEAERRLAQRGQGNEVLEERIKALKQQSDRASAAHASSQRYCLDIQQLLDDERAKNHEVISRHVAEIDSLKTQVAESAYLRSQVAELKAQIVGLDGKIVDLTSKQEDQHSCKNDPQVRWLERDRTALSIERDTLALKLQHADERHSLLSRTLHKLDSGNAACMPLIESLVRECRALSSETQGLSQRLSERDEHACVRCVAKDAIIDAERRSCAHLETEVNSLRYAASLHSESDQKLHARVADLESSLASQRNAWKILAAQYEESQRENAGMQAKLAADSSAMAQKKAEISALQAEGAQNRLLLKRFLELQASSEIADREKQQLVRDLESSTVKLAAADRERAELVGTLTCVCNQVSAGSWSAPREGHEEGEDRRYGSAPAQADAAPVAGRGVLHDAAWGEIRSPTLQPDVAQTVTGTVAQGGASDLTGLSDISMALSELHAEVSELDQRFKEADAVVSRQESGGLTLSTSGVDAFENSCSCVFVFVVCMCARVCVLGLHIFARHT